MKKPARYRVIEFKIGLFKIQRYGGWFFGWYNCDEEHCRSTIMGQPGFFMERMYDSEEEADRRIRRRQARAAIEAMRANLDFTHTVLTGNWDYNEGHRDGVKMVIGYFDAALTNSEKRG